MGEMTVGWLEKTNVLYEVNYVRTWVRKQRYGEDTKNRPEFYDVQVTRLDGEVQAWRFASNIGWPIIDGEVLDWNAVWMSTD